MPERFIKALGEAVQEIAETMLFVEITKGRAEKGRSTLGADHSAVIGYSAALKGSMRLAGPQSGVLKLAAALMGEERDTLDKEMEDAFAEMANMIAGGVQSRMEPEIGTIRMSPPVVISGRNHMVSSDRSFNCISHQFELEGEPFFTEIYYSEESLGDQDAEGRYGFVLASPNDKAGCPGAVAEPPRVDGEALAAAVRQAFAAEMEQWSREVASAMVSKMLPELAERMVREEIERIKKEGV